MQRQRALADSPLAGAHSHEMTHPGEPVGDAGALLRNLLKDSGPSVADDIVVALHAGFGDVAYPRLGGSRPRCVEQMPAGGAEPEALQALLRDFGRVDL